MGLSAASLAAGAVVAWRRVRTPAASPVHVMGTGDAQTPFQRRLRVPASSGLMADCPLRPGLKITARSANLAVFGTPPTRIWHYACDTGNGLAVNPVLHAEHQEMRSEERR